MNAWYVSQSLDCQPEGKRICLQVPNKLWHFDYIWSKTPDQEEKNFQVLGKVTNDPFPFKSTEPEIVDFS